MMLPMGAMPYMIGMTNIYSVPLALLLTLPMLVYSVRLYITLEMKFAIKVMFASFYYLPLILIIYLITKV